MKTCIYYEEEKDSPYSVQMSFYITNIPSNVEHKLWIMDGSK